MASIIKPAKKYVVNNCPVGTVDSRESKNHDSKYYENQDKFYIELAGDTRIEAEAVSNNNPVEFALSGEIIGR